MEVGGQSETKGDKKQGWDASSHLGPRVDVLATGQRQWKQWQTLFFWAPKSLQMVTAAMKLKDAYSLEGKL